MMADSSGDMTMENFNDEFISEIREDLELLEPDLLAMEKQGSEVGAELINHAFRAIHSIKGGAGFCGLKDLGALSHSMENVLMRIRDGRLKISSAIVDALLSGFDRMRLMVDSLNSGETIDFENEKNALQAIIDPGCEVADKPAVAAPPVESDPDTGAGEPGPESPDSSDGHYSVITPEDSIFQGKMFVIECDRIDEAAASGKFLYLVSVDPEKDLRKKGRGVSDIVDDISSTGEILFSELSDQDEPPGKDGSFPGRCVIIASILDTAFVTEVLEIPGSQLIQFEAPDAGSSDPCPIIHYQTVDRKETETPVGDPHGGEPVKQQVPSANPPLQDAVKRQGSAAVLKKPGETIRVNVELINRLMNLAGELVLSRNQLRPLLESHAQGNATINSVMQNLNLVTSEIQEDIMQIRMQPINNLLTRFERIVRDMARQLDRQVDFIIEGGDVELDRTVLEGLSNPFTHLIRNCVAHGIETPAIRRAAGKPETGTIKVKAFHQGGYVHLSIQDNGRGMEPGAIADAAVKKGLITQARADEMLDKEKLNLIFLPGFSTSSEITDLSGRGVGMDVVQTNIEALRGNIHIESLSGQGTTVNIIIPLTLAIVSALIVGCDNFRFAIPHVNVSEVVFLKPGDLQNSVENLGKSEVMRFRGRLLPVVRLRTLLGMKTSVKDLDSGRVITERRNTIADRRSGFESDLEEDQRRRDRDRRKQEWGAVYVVVLKVGVNRFGLCVEELYDTEEIVVKPLSQYIKDCRCFSGATILGDGKVIMILDVSGMASFSGLRFDAVAAEEQRRRELEKKQGTTQGQHRNVLVFSSSDNEFFALPLDRVARLEAVHPGMLHWIGSRKFIPHSNISLSLFTLEEFLSVTACSLERPTLHVIIPKGISIRAGLIVHDIIDTIEVTGPLDRDEISPDGIEGKLFIDGRLIQFIDIDRLSKLMERQITVTA